MTSGTPSAADHAYNASGAERTRTLGSGGEVDDEFRLLAQSGEETWWAVVPIRADKVCELRAASPTRRTQNQTHCVTRGERRPEALRLTVLLPNHSRSTFMYPTLDDSWSEGFSQIAIRFESECLTS